jgi:DNA-binding GntR family transcriptional regulator
VEQTLDPSRETEFMDDTITEALPASEIQRIQHGRAGAHISDLLRVAILDGEFAPGERLRQEELAQRYGSSRVPVREALRTMEGEGLVTHKASSGTWVSQLDPRECIELYRIRECLEPLLMEVNAPLLDAGQLDHLDELADRMSATEDATEFLRLDREFHMTTYAAAPTFTLTDTVVRLWNQTHHYRRAFVSLSGDGGTRAADLDHRLLVEALRRRDVGESVRVVELHVRRTRLALSQLDDAAIPTP